MATTHPVHFMLEEKTMKTIQSAVDSGKFATPEAFVAKAVASYQTEEEAMEEFIRTEAGSICDRVDADPSRRIPVEQVLRELGVEDDETRAA